LARYVLDANVIVGWLLARPGPTEFVAGLTTADDLVAAQLLLPECTSTLRSEVYDRRIEPIDAERLLGRVFELPLRLTESPRQFTRALELAHRFRRRNAYDMQYLAAAELSNCEIVTMDRGLRYAAEDIGVPVQFVT
jgi:predicted nucleic acid-binding protein